VHLSEFGAFFEGAEGRTEGWESQGGRRWKASLTPYPSRRPINWGLREPNRNEATSGSPLSVTARLAAARMAGAGVPRANIHGLYEHTLVQSVMDGREFLYRLTRRYADQRD
jgi:hypothetical protein